jgi:AcrR family transcriptional regulator
MPPSVKFQKEEIVTAALEVARQRGIDAVTAREVARALKVSVGPIFTWFDTMDQLKAEVYAQAGALYRSYIQRGLAGPIPFLGVGQQYIRFAREEPELYKLLFLTGAGTYGGGAMAALKLSQDLARDSVMRIYHMNATTADRYFRDLWLVVFSFATLIVTDDCPYSDEEMSAVLTEVSLSICKAYKEIPGLPEGKFDRDAIFNALVNAPIPASD